MTHLYGIPIDSNLTLVEYLAKVPGIGIKLSLQVCKWLGLSKKTRWSQLSLNQRNSLKTFLSGTQVEAFSGSKFFGSEYRREATKRKKAIIALGTFRGIRLRQGLPVRGQKTRSNAKTSKKQKNYG